MWIELTKRKPFPLPPSPPPPPPPPLLSVAFTATLLSKWPLSLNILCLSCPLLEGVSSRSSFDGCFLMHWIRAEIDTSNGQLFHPVQHFDCCILRASKPAVGLRGFCFMSQARVTEEKLENSVAWSCQHVVDARKSWQCHTAKHLDYTLRDHMISSPFFFSNVMHFE